jgi:Leucine-rich repeat (LRR) protein
MREFNVDNNQLEYIPKEIVAFSGLVTLKFHGNMLQRVEPAIGTITSIRKLTLDKNFLKDLPSELKSIPYVS